jgi:hypothetical protein
VADTRLFNRILKTGAVRLARTGNQRMRGLFRGPESAGQKWQSRGKRPDFRLFAGPRWDMLPPRGHNANGHGERHAHAG